MVRDQGRCELHGLWILTTARSLAEVEVGLAGEIVDREALVDARRLNPKLFRLIYTDLLEREVTRDALTAALDAIDDFLEPRAKALFRPVIDYLDEAGGEPRSATDIAHYFTRHYDMEHVILACEWLSDIGLIEKASTPVKLTTRSQTEVEELAFFMSTGKAVSRKGVARPAIRTSIAVQGARVHNLKNVSVEIPRDQLTVVTGLSGSGKSSLAFDTVYAEGQRRYMESLSSYAKRFIAQVEKPDVDFVYGLSPVVSIEQKTIARNPRSTVGTLTDVSSYLNLLFATISEGHCPYSDEPVPVKTGSQIVESLLKLPRRAEVELRAPIFQVYGEDPEFIFNEIRKLGCRYVDIDGERVDLTDVVPDTLPGDPKLSAVVDRLVLVPGVEKQLKAAVEQALRVGDSLLSAAVVGGTTQKEAKQFAKTFGSARHALVYGDIVPDFFMFNNPESACRTCGGIGTDKRTHPDLLITNPERSIREGCFLRDAFNYRPDNHRGYTLYSLAQENGFDLDTPWAALDEKARDLVLYGTRGEPLQLRIPPDAKVQKEGGCADRTRSKASPAASSGTTAGIASAMSRVPVWRPG